jgi:hypothetical protein
MVCVKLSSAQQRSAPPARQRYPRYRNAVCQAGGDQRSERGARTWDGADLKPACQGGFDQLVARSFNAGVPPETRRHLLAGRLTLHQPGKLVARDS